MRRSQAGISLVEIAVALLIASLGALGFLTMMLSMQSTESETIEREIATRLVMSMVAQIKANPYGQDCYSLNDWTPNPVAYVGTGYQGGFDCGIGGPDMPLKQAGYDLQQWHNQLLGAGVALDTDNDNTADTSIGAMTGARGCISYVSLTRTYTVTVAWQGKLPSATPTSTCGQNLYGNENLRRVLTVTLEMPDLA